MDGAIIRRFVFGRGHPQMEVRKMIENIALGSMNVMMAVIAVMLLARFGPAPKTNAPIHWLKLQMTENVKMKIESVTVGLAQDFDAVAKIAVPNSILEHRPETILARIAISDADWKNDADDILVLQKSAVNDLLHILDEKAAKGVKKGEKWSCTEAGCFDIWTPISGMDGVISVDICHAPLNSAGSRSAYTVEEVTDSEE